MALKYISLRVEEADVAELTRRHGTVSKGVRAAIEEHLRGTKYETVAYFSDTASEKSEPGSDLATVPNTTPVTHLPGRVLCSTCQRKGPMRDCPKCKGE